MKLKLNCVCYILTGNTRLELCFSEKLDLAGGKGKYILFWKHNITKDTKVMVLCLRESEKRY